MVLLSAAIHIGFQVWPIKVYFTLLQATIVVIDVVVAVFVVVVVVVVVANCIVLTLLIVADPIIFSLVNKCSLRLL